MRARKVAKPLQLISPTRSSLVLVGMWLRDRKQVKARKCNPFASETRDWRKSLSLMQPLSQWHVAPKVNK